MVDNGDRANDPAEKQASSSDGRAASVLLAPLALFQETLDGLRDLHSEVMPHVHDLDKQRLSPEALTVLRALPAKKRRRLRDLLAAAYEKRALLSEKEAPSEDLDPGGDDGAEKGGDQELGLASVLGSQQKELTEIFAEHDEARLEFSVRLNRTLIAPLRSDLLRNSLLTMAVAAFEVLIGRIVGAKFATHPDSLGTEPEFSLAQLERFADISEARDLLIENRVDSFVRRDFDYWADWFKKDSSLRLNFDSLCIDRAALSEVFQRRHIIVHNGGQVSRRYLQNTSLTDPPPLNQFLAVPPEYLDGAIDQLDALGTLLVVGAWAKLYPDEAEVAYAFMSERSQQLMYIGRWSPVRCICAIGKKLEGKTTKQRCEVFKVNHWLAVKRLDGLDQIRSEIDAWDTSALDPVFPFVRAALLDDLNEVFAQLPGLLKSGSLNRASLEQWPILEELRADARYDGLLGDFE